MCARVKRKRPYVVLGSRLIELGPEGRLPPFCSAPKLGACLCEICKGLWTLFALMVSARYWTIENRSKSKKADELYSCGFEGGGQGWIRTSEGISQRIYSRRGPF
jgi:hypothetical protein